MKDIVKDTEITISYLGSHIDEAFDKRQAYLLKQYVFQCTCSACTLPPKERAIDDSERASIRDMDAILGRGMLLMNNPAKALKYCRGLLRLRTAHHRGREIHRTYYDAFQVCVAHGDKARASAFMQLNNEFVEMFDGKDAVTAEKKRLALNPEGHRLFEMCSRRWRYNAGAQKKKGEEGFEEWLWARAEA